MAEAALFSVASKILSTVASPAFATAYERAYSVLKAPDELKKLESTIRTIQAGVLDAERKQRFQKESNLVTNWLQRAKEVLYDADDLFDEVATDDLLRRHVKGSNVLTRTVRASVSWVVSNDNVAQKVRDIRQKLQDLSQDMAPLNLESCPPVTPKEQDPGSFVDPKNVIGRDKDKEAILGLLLGEDHGNDNVQVIAIVGIGGMGKTTLAQLVYNHEEVKRCFEERWFACISDTSDDAEVCRKIYKSITRGGILQSTSDLQSKIKESIEGKKFLLVLNDVWDDDLNRWQNRMDLLKSGAKGSKIIVSTRSSLVERAVGASRTHALSGLSEKDSWHLFKRVVKFTPEQEKDDSPWAAIGREIVKKCANVPLAIKWLASLLSGENDIKEWESIRNIELPRLGQSHKGGIMPVLKLSYDHLPSNLKPCFAYCSLFPKDLPFKKEELIYLWIAQGYVHANEMQAVEDVGHSYFMDLVKRSLIVKPEDESHGTGYKMHALIHDLAIHVAGEESRLLTASSNKFEGTRHVSVAYDIVDGSWPLLDSVNQLRSLLFYSEKNSRLQVQQKQFENFKSLRGLSLPSLQIEDVPDSIGQLKHLRYLDISSNKFKQLPDSITKLVNLCTLNISNCRSLEVWPNSFRKLISLRHLHNRSCLRLKHLPPGCEELPSLQHLDLFVAGKGRSEKLNVLAKLKLKGELTIQFTNGVDDWDRVEGWQPPQSLQGLTIYGYEGARIPHWCNKDTSSLPHLVSLTLTRCTRVKCLPPLRHIPNIKRLVLSGLKKLEYIEDDESNSDAFVPDLEGLEFTALPELKGWSQRGEQDSSSASSSPQLLSFPNLSFLDVYECPKLEWWGDKKSGVDWDSCKRLKTLKGFPSSFKIPECLVRRQQLDLLKIEGS